MYQRPRVVFFICLLLFGCGGKHRVQYPNPKFFTYAKANLEVIPGEYLVMFDSAAVSETSVPILANLLVAGTQGRVSYLFTKTLRGFAATNLNDVWANAVSARPDVTFVRKNFRIYGKELRGNAFGPVPWNLDRVDQRTSFKLDRDYRFKTGPVGPAPPVPIYILDNGVYKDHVEFASISGSRVEDVADVMGTNFAKCTAPAANANHGTRAASIAAGVKLGITPTLIKNIKVLDKDFINSSCIAGSPTTVSMGLEETYKHMQSNNITKAVVNLSLGWNGPTPDVTNAIQRLQMLGAIVVAAGGNENRDAAVVTPANAPDVLAVGATTESDARLVISPTNGSNFGSTISVWAPGTNIVAADWQTSNPNATDIASGTSDAAPHVAGAAALLWQQNPSMSAKEIMSLVKARATRNMLTGLGSGSTNALLYIGEDAPAKVSEHSIPRLGSDGDLLAVRTAGNRLYVAGGDLSRPNPSRPYAFAGYDTGNLGVGPVWQVSGSANPIQDCVDIHVLDFAYFGCMGTHNGAREAIVIATKKDGTSAWQQPQPAWLGAGSVIRGLTAGVIEGSQGVPVQVFAIGTRPNRNGREVFITSFDAFDGPLIKSAGLSAPGFNEQFHEPVDLVLVDFVNNTGTRSTDLVAVTYSDPPGADKTFLWKLDPQTLQVKDWREVPAPPLAQNGMFATALAAQSLEDNTGRVTIPGEVFLATTSSVLDGGRTVPWGYIFRLNPDRVTANQIDVVKEAFISTLWSEDGDLYFAGMTTRTFPPGNLLGIPKAGSLPDYDAFLGKSEGVFNSRRWMLSYNSKGVENNSGYCGSGANKAYIVGSDSSAFYVIEYQVY